MKTLCILQARVSSTRLPGKVLKPIIGRPMIAHQVERILRAKGIDHLVIATSVDESDVEIEALCESLSVDCRRGSLPDVLDRYYHVAREYQPEHVVRLTADCPLTDPTVLDALVELHLREGSMYTSNTIERTFPHGLDAEIFTFGLLLRAWREAKTPFEREHVTPYMYSGHRQFPRATLKDRVDRSWMRWTVDYQEDFEFVKRIFEELYATNPAFTSDDVYDLLEARPELVEINAQRARCAGGDVRSG